MSPKVFISLCLNVVLGALWFFMTRSGTEVREGDFSPAKSSFSTKSAGLPVVTITNLVKPEFKWSQLETTDYKEYIRRLRLVGCPESTIRDIIISDLDNMYEPKLNKLKGINPVAVSEPYWLVNRPTPQPKPSPEVEKEIKGLAEERAALVKDLLGVTEKAIRADLDWYDDAKDSRYSFLNAEQREKLMSLEKEKEDLRRDNGHLTWSMEDAWLKQALTKMKEFMSDEEISEYRMRNSREAKILRGISGVIDMNESEFREVFQLAMKDKEEGPSTTEKQREKREEEMLSGMVSILGEERFKDIQRAKQDSYKDLLAAAPFLGYDREAARQVYQMQNDVLEAMRAINRNANFSPEAKASALREMRQATEKRVGEIIGPKGLIYYRQRGGGWIRQISPPGGVSTP